MKKPKKKLSERTEDLDQDFGAEEDFDQADQEECFGFKEDEIELLSALKHKKRLEDN